MEFIAFVIKDWAAEIATEAAVTLEFMDPGERGSIVSHSSWESEGEEEELQHDLQASYMSTQTENLIHN